MFDATICGRPSVSRRANAPQERLRLLLRGLSFLVAGLLVSDAASAQIPDTGVRIGVMTDMSGQCADFAGPGSVVAAQLAAEDFGGRIGGRAVTVLAADHQNKPDVAAAMTRRWFDEGVHMAIDYPVSSAALAAQEIGRDKKRIIIYSSAGTPLLSGKACSPYGFQWMFDSYSLSAGLAGPLKARGIDSFFFITADYIAGTTLEAEFRGMLDRTGLKAVGGVKYALNAPDMSSPVLTALASPAKALVLAGAGSDMANAIKAAQDFGIRTSNKVMVTPATFITDIKALGLHAAQGLIFVDAFYWDRDERSRRFARRFAARFKGAMPTSAQAGVYSGTRHYLRAVEAANSIDADRVAEKMRELTVDDDVFPGSRVRPDQRLEHDMLVVQVKQPSSSKGEWDLEEIIGVVPGHEALRPLASSECPLVKKAN